MSTPLLIILVTLLLAFTCIDFRSIFFSRGISFMAIASHVPHTTGADYKQTIYWVNRNKTCESKSGSYPSKLSARCSPHVPVFSEAFRNNIFLDSLLLIFDGLKKVKFQDIGRDHPFSMYSKFS